MFTFNIFIEETNLDDSISSIPELPELPALPAADKSPELKESIRSGDSEKSVSEISSDPSPEASASAAIPESDDGRADALNATMIIKTEAQVKEEMAEDISRSILERLIDETIEETIRRSRQSGSPKPETGRPSVDVLQRVNVMLSGGSGSGRSSQMYMTTTFDIFSSDESEDESGSPEGSPLASGDPADGASAEERHSTPSKLEQIEVENDEWIDDDLEVAVYASAASSSSSSASSAASENRVKVIEEAEALEREQIRIEQEIQRLSAGSVLYLREIPNKPPPPYTPPGQVVIRFRNLFTTKLIEL